MFYQLQSFDSEAPESTISYQVGVLQGVFSAAQIFTSVIWGRVADSPSWGRKNVILLSLIGQSISCLGIGFSSSFTAAVIWRTLGGAVNATVGGARTTLAEKTEKKFHSRTFLLLPLAWNVANIFGPPIGGMLSDPVQFHTSWFGRNSFFGGKDGVAWLIRYPYAPPNICCALLMFADAMLVFLFLEETLESRQFYRDRGLELGTSMKLLISRYGRRHSGYARIMQALENESDSPVGGSSNTELDPVEPRQSPTPRHKERSQAVTARSIMTWNVFLVMMTIAGVDFQLGGFTALWSMFLSTERRNPQTDAEPQLPFKFSGGVGFQPSTVGIAMSLLGFVGIFCQLTLYPRINARFGLIRSTRYALLIFPIPYAIAPYLSLLTASTTLHFLLWPGIAVVALLMISARTFAIPGIVLLTNNASPGPEVLGTLHGLGAAVSSAFKTIGPIVAGRWYGDGYAKGIIGQAWWFLSLSALLGCLPAFWVKDGV